MNIATKYALLIALSAADAVDVTISYQDIGKGGAAGGPPKTKCAAYSAITAEDELLSADGSASAYARQITSIIIRNKGAGANTVTLKMRDANGDEYEIVSDAIAAGGHLVYERGQGFAAFS